MLKMKKCSPVLRYYPVKEEHGEWVLIEPEEDEGSGKEEEGSAFGEIYQACNGDDCEYIMKYQEFEYGRNSKEKITEEDFLKEVDLQNQISMYGLTIPVVDSWICKDGCSIVMKKLKCDLIQLLDQYSNRSVIKEILYESISLIQKLHILGYYHGDLHLGNIMVDYENIDGVEDELETYRMRKHKFYLIDFGMTNYIPIDDRSVITFDYGKFLARYTDYISRKEPNIKRTHSEILIVLNDQIFHQKDQIKIIPIQSFSI
jgi:tRNA A-37 threonylcarbamoyl transferase component Bud32